MRQHFVGLAAEFVNEDEISPAIDVHSDALAPRFEDRFDYENLELPGDKRDELLNCRRRIVAIRNKAAVDIGRELLIAKKILTIRRPRGAWSQWLKTALDISETSARNFMATAEWALECPIIERLPPSACYLAARGSSELRSAVVRRLEDGEALVIDDVKRIAATIGKVVPAAHGTSGESSPQADKNLQDEPSLDTATTAAKEIMTMLKLVLDDSQWDYLYDRLRTTTWEHLKIEFESTFC